MRGGGISRYGADDLLRAFQVIVNQHDANVVRVVLQTLRRGVRTLCLSRFIAPSLSGQDNRRLIGRFLAYQQDLRQKNLG